jgi:hypothetical protein
VIRWKRKWFRVCVYIAAAVMAIWTYNAFRLAAGIYPDAPQVVRDDPR